MSDSNTVVILEARIEELQSINNKLTSELTETKKKLESLMKQLPAEILDTCIWSTFSNT